MGEREKENRLEALLNMRQLQSLQDDLAQALGLAFLTVDYRGFPVTRSSGFTAFCSCMQKHEKYGQLCGRCHAHGGLHATITGEPFVYCCHGGLVEFAVPLMVEGKYLGAVLGGQCELTEEPAGLEPVVPQRTPWETEPELAQARKSVPKTTFEKLQAGVRLLRQILQHLLEQERSRRNQEELRQRNRELLEERTARVNLELREKEQKDAGGLVECLDREQLFYMLNVISRLAFLEKAQETERTACDFASMMRYVLENGEYNCVTLGEELEYIDFYLQIQQRRTEGRLHFEIQVPERFYSILCPFMMLHPLVENTVKYVLDNSRDGGSVTLRGREAGEHLVLAICCDCRGITGQRIGQVLELESKRQGSPLARADQSLKRIFGKDFGIFPGNREDGQPGKEMRIHLPLDGENPGKLPDF